MTNRAWTAQRNEVGNPPIPLRLSPELRQRIKEYADRDFQGNVSELIRTATRLYLDVRERRAAEDEEEVA
jgi:Arc/MetJ-type ribon-helix-helix transcriptional regulator